MNDPLRHLRETAPPPAPLFARTSAPDSTGAGHSTDLGGGVMLHADPAAVIRGHWASPSGRLLEIAARIEAPGDWFALHIPLSGLSDLGGIGWIGLIARTSADATCALRPCLRSGLGTGPEAGGFRDDFLPRHILAGPRESDHCDTLAPAHLPDLAQSAPWRELVLFLPAAASFHLMLHDLRVFTQ